jgi:hypothetical protein
VLTARFTPDRALSLAVGCILCGWDPALVRPNSGFYDLSCSPVAGGGFHRPPRISRGRRTLPAPRFSLPVLTGFFGRCKREAQSHLRAGGCAGRTPPWPRSPPTSGPVSRLPRRTHWGRRRRSVGAVDSFPSGQFQYSIYWSMRCHFTMDQRNLGCCIAECRSQWCSCSFVGLSRSIISELDEFCAIHLFSLLSYNSL